MESSSASQLSPKSPHTLTANTDVINNVPNCEHPTVQYRLLLEEAETILANRDAIGNTLKEHIKRLEELYKKVVYQSEENRLKYWMVLQELESCKKFHKIRQNGDSRNSNKKCSKEITVNLSSNNETQANEKQVLPLRQNEISTTNNGISVNDQYVVIKKALSVQDLRLQVKIEKRRIEETCTCDEQQTLAKNTLLDAKESIIRKLKEESEQLKQEVAALKQQLAEEQKETPVLENAPGDAGSLEMRYNSLLQENDFLREDLAKALVMMEKQRSEMLKIEEQNLKKASSQESGNDEDSRSTASAEDMEKMSAFFMERLDELYQQNKVNSRLINEIFWQLHEIEDNTKSMRQLLETAAGSEKGVRKPLSEKPPSTNGDLKNSSKGGEQNEKQPSPVQSRCEVATNCLTYCGCEAERYLNGKERDNGSSNLSRSTEIKQENLDVPAISSGRSVDDAPAEPVNVDIDDILAAASENLICRDACNTIL